MMDTSKMRYAKKVFSLALLFNAFLTLEYAVQILFGFYSSYPNWRPFPPFIFNGSIFWAIIPTAVINFFPAVSTGQTKCGRLWFHHYVYGLVVAMVAGGSLLIFTSIPPLDLFTRNITDVNVNIGRFFVLGGLTLVVDDLPDVSGLIRKFTNYLKSNAYKRRKALHLAQLILGFVSLYICSAIVGYILIDNRGFTLANSILIGTLLVTSLTSFASVQRRIWLDMTYQPERPSLNG
jgi:hypothetical protein